MKLFLLLVGVAMCMDVDTKRLKQTNTLLRKTLETLGDKNARSGYEDIPAQRHYPKMITISESCSDFVNGVWRIHTAQTGTGKPTYYKTGDDSKRGTILYYDPDCNGGGTEPRLIFDTNEGIDISRESDIDGDSNCRYYSRLAAASMHIVPEGEITLRSYCNGAWVDDDISVTHSGSHIECWTESTDGRAFADVMSATADQYYVYTNLKYSECVQKANEIDVELEPYYFAYSATLKNGFCQILNPEYTHPAISQSNSNDIRLYVNTCQPSIALVNKDSFEISGAFDWGSGWYADSINGPFGQDELRLYTGLDPFMNWAQIREGSVIPKVGVWYGMGVQYVLCEENVSFSGIQKKYYFSVNDGVPQCTTQA